MKDDVVRLRFFGKGGKRIQRILYDAPLARALAALKAQPGEMLFRWRGKDGEDGRLTADMVNAALRQRCGDMISAKDFRTFRASSIVAAGLQELPRDNAAARGGLLKQSIKASASFLANTPTVARSSYVHPLVQDAFTDAILDPAILFTGPVRTGLNRGETALLRLLERRAET